MTRIFKMVIVLTIITALLVTGVGSVLAVNANNSVFNMALKDAVNIITQQYSEFYEISNISTSVLYSEENQLNNDYYVEIYFDRTLFAREASELPFLMGVSESVNNIVNSSVKNSANEYYTNLITEIENKYIGKPQSTCVEVCISIPKLIVTSKSLSEQCCVNVIGVDGEKLSPGVLKPQSRNDMYKMGQDTINRILTLNSADETINQDILLYDRVQARDYARDWSCTKAYTTDHDTCHNPDYSFYNNADCANFVSQCLHEGGIPTDSVWLKDSYAWINVDGLCNYVVNNNLFFSTYDETKAFAGSIIRWSDYAHVGLVDQNDTVTLTFCAHNVCRKSCPWTGENVYFYVPFWDSYAGEWTE